MAYNGDPLFDARKLTPSPNPVESLRALPLKGDEIKPVAWFSLIDDHVAWGSERPKHQPENWCRLYDQETIDMLMGAINANASVIAAWNRRSASAPDAVLLTALRRIRSLALKNIAQAHDIAAEALAKHSTAAEEV